ncbi:hypothetical protein TPAU25S_02843 [Tsukamurella paurometabola]
MGGRIVQGKKDPRWERRASLRPPRLADSPIHSFVPYARSILRWGTKHAVGEVDGALVPVGASDGCGMGLAEQTRHQIR